jgi:hypothetical protein
MASRYISRLSSDMGSATGWNCLGHLLFNSCIFCSCYNCMCSTSRNSKPFFFWQGSKNLKIYFIVFRVKLDSDQKHHLKSAYLLVVTGYGNVTAEA